MSMGSYHDYHNEAKTQHRHAYSSLTLTVTLIFNRGYSSLILTLTPSPSMKDYVDIFQQGVLKEQKFHSRRAQTNTGK